MSNNENNNSVDSIHELFEEAYYCRDVIPILTKNANDHSATAKVTEDLERERLRLEHAEIDKKIAAILKRIEKAKQEDQELDRQLFNANELNNHAMTRFQRTGEMINVLKGAAEDAKSQAKKMKIRQQNIKKKVDEIKAKKLKNEELEIKKECLQQKIKALMNEPEPQLDQNLVEENISLKKKLTETIESLKIKRLKKEKTKALKDATLNAMQQVCQAQERNSKFKEEVDKKKESLRDQEHEMQEKFGKLQEKINNDIQKRNDLLEDYNKSANNVKETQKRIEEVKGRVTEKEKELGVFKEKIKARQEDVKKENERLQNIFAGEINKLKIVEQNLKECLDENEQYKQALSTKSQKIMDLKDKKGDLILQLCEKKNKLVVQQHQNVEQQTKIDGVTEKLETATRQVEEAKAKDAGLDARLEQLNKELVSLPLKHEEAREKVTLSHQEKIGGLLKQQNFQEATIDFLQFRLDEHLKKVEGLQKEIQDFDEGWRWEEMKYEMRKTKAEELQKRLKKEQETGEKLAAEVKKKEAINAKGKRLHQKTMNNVLEKTDPSGSAPPIHQDDAHVEEVSVVEDEEKTSQSGRKSPGILKSPHRIPKAHVMQPNKRVTFEGLSSTSSESIKSCEEAEKNTNTTFDEFLRDWANTNYSSTTGMAGNRKLTDI